ncbi:MAG: 4Fe-4S dicluster domain-containing protein [Porphyromonadaceae bacterium]|nr:MAG: 4Fe-4S dicluster domain-containing protein [Porphyromonadaceae bacterium]
MAGKKNFGFERHAGRQIDLDHADNSLATELAEVVSAWSACISCGSCAATCPAGQNVGFNFRRLHYKIKLSLEVETDNYPSLLTSCLLCGKCQLVCPRGIPTRYLSIQIMQKTKHYAEVIPPV